MMRDECDRVFLFSHHPPWNTAMKRKVQSELLDSLPPNNPNAVRSRRDLRRVNAWMRNQTVMADALHCDANGNRPKQIIDLGSGDGSFLLGVARRLAASWMGAEATLLDRQPVVTRRTLAAFARLGWRAQAMNADVFNWARTAANNPTAVVTANLFLHHFTDLQLVELLHAIGNRVRLFVAVEPRRAVWPLFCSRWLWVIGCNTVTRHDAPVSVRAGFAQRELSALWTARDGWQLTERSAGLFNHLFVAQKIG